MQSSKNSKLSLLLNLMAHSRLYSPFKNYTAGAGIIFTLHRISESTPETFSPNSILQIKPDYLDTVIQSVIAHGYEIITIDEVRTRLLSKSFTQKFVCFTFDDGYEDTLTHALPVFERHNAPFTVYVNSGMMEGTTVFWWQHLEDIINSNPLVKMKLAGTEHSFSTATVQEKHSTFERIYWKLRAMKHSEQRDTILELLERYQINPADLCRELSLNWSQVNKLASSDLVTLGAHTLSHFALAKLTPQQVQDEIEQGQTIMENNIGRRSNHFAYPFGDPLSAGKREFEIADKLSFGSAVTQRKGVIFPEHAKHLHALPRVSLNGDFQNAAFVPVLLSGLPFSLLNRCRKLNVD